MVWVEDVAQICVAMGVVQAGSYSSNSTPRLGISICQWFSSKKQKKKKKRKWILGVPVMAQWKQIQLGTIRLWVRSLALLSGLRVQHCHELWCRLQMQLGSCVAVAVA